MLIQVQCPCDNKGQIILQDNIDRIFNGYNLQPGCILIVRTVQCIVQLQQCLSVLLKQEPEQSVLRLPVHLMPAPPDKQPCPEIFFLLFLALHTVSSLIPAGYRGSICTPCFQFLPYSVKSKRKSDRNCLNVRDVHYLEFL